MRKKPSAVHADAFLDVAKAVSILQPKDRNWNHTVCHMLEDGGSEYGNSVLDYLDSGLSQYSDGINLLAAAAFREENCMNRVLLPILWYNLDMMAKNPESQDFALMPPSFRDPANQKIAKDLEEPDLLLFMTSRNPKELWEMAIAGNVPLYNFREVQKCTSAPVAPDVLANYIKACYGSNLTAVSDDVSGNVLLNNLKIPLDSPEPGLFVDVDGTLVKYGSLQKKLVASIEAAFAAGIPITIFSGGNPKEQTEKLLELGLSDKFLPVRSKSDFKGKALECLVDDTAPVIGGFATKNYIMPSNSGFGELDAWLEQNRGMDI